MALEIRQMRHVLALAEHGSFARAAVALHLSQPALSRSIQLLEQRIGSALFLRSAVGVVPTDLGRLLAQRARQLVQLAEDLDQEVLSDRTLQAGQLRIGAGSYPVESVITTALARFIKAHPAIGVGIQVRDWDEFLPRLRSRELDFFVAEISTLKNEPDLEVEALSEHPVYFVGRRAHPLAGRDNLTAAETFAYPFIVMSRIPPRMLEPMLQARRKFVGRKTAPQAFPAMEFNVLAAVKRIVESSDAVTALTLSCCAAELQQRRLALLGTKPWLSSRYGIVSLKGHPMSSAALRFREFVVRAEAEVAPAEEQTLARWQSSAAVDGATPRTRSGRTRAPR
jgi:DNA-binding transcriptional LysR family regulator